MLAMLMIAKLTFIGLSRNYEDWGGWGRKERIVNRDDSGSREIGVRLINSISENDGGVL